MITTAALIAVVIAWIAWFLKRKPAKQSDEKKADHHADDTQSQIVDAHADTLDLLVADDNRDLGALGDSNASLRKRLEKLP
jgi:flagellar biosynthesis/type III secretory pathway M-ring protein FliF/YscJ